MLENVMNVANLNTLKLQLPFIKMQRSKTLCIRSEYMISLKENLF